MGPFILGISYKSAPLEVQEVVSLASREAKQRALEALASRLAPVILLATCNRTELYTLEASGTRESAQGFLQEYFHLGKAELEPYVYAFQGRGAVRHLFRVVTGLDSLAVGEGEILGQVRAAYRLALEAGVLHGRLARLFQDALQVGRSVRQEAGLSARGVSIGAACAELAQRELGSLEGRAVLVVGAGKGAATAARAFKERGASPLRIANRTLARARRLAAVVEGEAFSFQELRRALERVEVVVSSTGASEYVLTRSLIEEALIDRGQGRLLIYDMAVPRDVDPAVAGLPGVWVRDMRDIEAHLRQADGGRWDGVLRQAEAQVEARAEEEWRWWERRPWLQTRVALGRWSEDIRGREVARALQRLPELTPHQRAAVEALSRALVKKLIHPAMAHLDASETWEELELLRQVFRLGGDGSRGAP